MTLQTLLKKLVSDSLRTGVNRSLALHRRGEVRQDGLTLTKASYHLEIEWRAREIHPWDRGCSPREEMRLFTEQCFSDTEAAICRLFAALPVVDLIQFHVIHPNSEDQLLGGTVARSVLKQAKSGASTRGRLWQMGVDVGALAINQPIAVENSPYRHPVSSTSGSVSHARGSVLASDCHSERKPNK
jgi:hypothetical protein